MEHLDDLFLFVQVVDAGGFSAAEHSTGIAKSRLSRRVAMLETALGVRLLHRSAHAFGLTPVGEEVAAQAREALAKVEQIRELTSHARDEPSGVLHLNASLLLGETILPPLLAEFARTYPRVRVQLSLSNRFVDLTEERIDIVIRASAAPLASEDVVARSIARSRSAVYAHPSLLVTTGPPQSLDALADFPCLAQGTLVAPRPWQFVGEAGEPVEVRVVPVIAVDNLLAIHELAMAGAGLAQLPCNLCEAAERDGRLVRVLEHVRSQGVTIHAMYPSRRGMTQAARVLLDFLQARWPTAGTEPLTIAG